MIMRIRFISVIVLVDNCVGMPSRAQQAIGRSLPHAVRGRFLQPVLKEALLSEEALDYYFCL